MDGAVDSIGGALLRGLIALVLWMVAATIVHTLAIRVFSNDVAGILGIFLGFAIVFVGATYWYYRGST